MPRVYRTETKDTCEFSTGFFENHLTRFSEKRTIISTSREDTKMKSKAIKASDFAERISPRDLGFSPKMAAIVGAIIGHDYGVRDSRGGQLTSLAITSDGYVTA